LPIAGYYSGEEILACEEAGITVYLPKPITSGINAKGRFGKQDFVYVAEDDVYLCPAGEQLTYRYTNEEDGKVLRRYWPCPCRKPIDWRLTENRAMLICNERSCQAHCLGGCRSVSVAGSDRGRDFNVAAADHCSATNRRQETNLRCHRPIGVRWSLSPLPSRS
jgi:hypothetical protein